MKIYKVNFELVGDFKVIDIKKIEEYKDLNALVKCYNLQDLEEDVFDYFNNDYDYLCLVSKAKSIEEFVKNNELYTIKDLREHFIENNTIYLFRSNEHSKNTLLATFEGFKNIGECKEFCVKNDLDYSEYKSSTSLREFNNCYFIDSKEKFQIYDIDCITTEESSKCDIHTIYRF